MTDRDELRRIALAATPGPWHQDDTPDDCVPECIYDATGHGICDTMHRQNRMRNAKFIATYSPSVALDLIHRLEVAERALELGVSYCCERISNDPFELHHELMAQAERQIAKEQV